MIDELLYDLANQGWLVNNCYQVDAALWRISLRRPVPNGDWFTDWAEGTTLEDAITECMSKLLDATFAEDTPVTYTLAPEQSLAELLKIIRRPSIPIKRRF